MGIGKCGIIVNVCEVKKECIHVIINKNFYRVLRLAFQLERAGLTTGREITHLSQWRLRIGVKRSANANERSRSITIDECRPHTRLSMSHHGRTFPIQSCQSWWLEHRSLECKPRCRIPLKGDSRLRTRQKRGKGTSCAWMVQSNLNFALNSGNVVEGCEISTQNRSAMTFSSKIMSRPRLPVPPSLWSTSTFCLTWENQRNWKAPGPQNDER